jgi:hypothetical protein
MEGFNDKVKKSLSFLDNPYVSGTLTLIIILYASLAAPKLPHKVAKLFGHNVFKMLFCFLILYFSVKDVSFAILLSIALVISLQTLNRLSFEEQIRQWTTFSLDENKMAQQPMMSQPMMGIPTKQMPNGGMNMGMDSMAVMEDQAMPMDVGFETGAMTANYNNSAVGILGADPDADLYGAI